MSRKAMGRGRKVRGGVGRMQGFSLSETVIVLAVAALLVAALAPVAKATSDRARDLRAETDAEAIRDALVSLLLDTGTPRIRTHGTDGPVVHLLVSDGDIPRELSEEGDPRWQAKVDSETGLVDFLERHLITNTPAGKRDRAWRVPPSLRGKGWRGAYLPAGVGADPWGNRYMVNVQFFGRRPSVVVLSSGPDEVIDARFEPYGAVGRGDDILVLVEA